MAVRNAGAWYLSGGPGKPVSAAVGFIQGEGLMPRGFAAVIKVLNPGPISYENNIPCGKAAAYATPRAWLLIIGKISGNPAHVLFTGVFR
jgi:hypothetical protein